MSTLLEGTRAPDLTLVSHQGEEVTLSQRLGRGPVVLAFFPLAFTDVGTEEMCEFQKGLPAFTGLGAEVFGISVDSRFSLAEFAGRHNLEFNREVAAKYGVLYQDFLGMKGVAKRSVFVSEPEGMIRYRWVTEGPKVKPYLEEIRKVCREIARGRGGRPGAQRSQWP